jgi:hypothetical protein
MPPIAIVFTAATYLLAGITLANLCFRKFRNRFRWLYFMAGSLLSAAFIFLAGQWAYTSIYIRWVFLGLYLLFGILSILRNRALPMRETSHEEGRAILKPLLFFILSLLYLAFIGFVLKYIFIHTKGNMPLRIGGIVVFLLLMAYSYWWTRKAAYWKASIGRHVFYSGRTYIICISGILLVFFLNGYNYNRSEAVEVEFPLHHGKYFIMQGGASRLTNVAHRNFSIKKYGYAMDIAELNSWGNRASTIHTMDLDKYVIFKDTVFSPCDGQVLQAVNTVRNNRPGEYNRVQVHGNHIIIQSKGYRVFMAHFLKGSVMVKVGDSVKTGQPLGLVGNSGFTAEPHLHFNILKDYAPHTFEKADINRVIEAQKHDTIVTGAFNEFPYDGTSVPALFHGRFYNMNDVILQK